MKIQSNFENWDFDNIWAIQEGLTYPYFQNMNQFWLPTISYDTICAGEDYNVHPFYLENVTENITLTDTIADTLNGIDRVRILRLIVQQPVEIADEIDICEDALPFYYALADTTFEVGTPANSQFLFRRATQQGCDSIISLQLTIRYPQQISHSLDGCHLLTWNGETYTTSGIYTQEFGCDSVVSLYVTIATDYHVFVVDSVLQGDPYTNNGFQIPADSTQDVGTLVQTNHYTSVLGCDSAVTLTLHIISGTGIHTQKMANAITIHPNPARDYVTISVSDGISVRQVFIYDICGSLVRQASHVRVINISTLPRGVYMLKIATNQGVMTKKLVVGTM